MMLGHRTSHVVLPALPKLAFGAIDFDRLSSSLLAVALVLSVAFTGLTAARIVRIERDYQPALQDTRRLSATLDATRALLRDSRLGAAESRIARADSLAQRFHLIASETRSEGSARMLAYDARFGEFYVAARRAAARITMSLDADGSSAEDASLGYGMLRGSLDEGIQAQEQAIDAARPATSPVELASWLALTLLSSAALLRRAARRRKADWPVAATASTSDDDFLAIPAGDGPSAVRLREAVERLARKRLAASVAAAKVAKRNNERQVELARSWNVPMLSITPTEQPTAGMDVYTDEQAEAEPMFGRLMLVSV